MAARSVWSGSISFAVLSIPCKLYTATESKDVAFHQLHAECNSRIKQKKWCPVDNREITMDEIVKGYEWAKDQYVLVTEQDMDDLPVPAKKVIGLQAFVDLDQVDSTYVEKAYWLEPEAIGAKPYALLLQAMKTRKVAAVATIALRTKERICSLRPSADGSVIVLETLFWPDELRTMGKPPEVTMTAPELAMAEMLIDTLHEPFTPENYKDQYRESLLNMIDAKRTGQVIEVIPVAEPAPAPDLMAALRASIESAKTTRKAQVA